MAKLTADLVLGAPQFMNPLGDREIDLRGACPGGCGERAEGEGLSGCAVTTVCGGVWAQQTGCGWAARIRAAGALAAAWPLPGCGRGPPCVWADPARRRGCHSHCRTGEKVHMRSWRRPVLATPAAGGCRQAADRLPPGPRGCGGQGGLWAWGLDSPPRCPRRQVSAAWPRSLTAESPQQS